jgi:ribonuclease HII
MGELGCDEDEVPPKFLKPLAKVNWRKLGVSVIAGTDEVGRGCLAGPVYAAAVILCPDSRLRGLTDSKLIKPELRTEIAEQIKMKAKCWSVGSASVEEIEGFNILQASLLAMRRAVEGLKICPEMVLIDGNKKIGGPWAQATYVQGDLRCQPISAASIIAKVARDIHMVEFDEKYPQFGFGKNKGYGTPDHHEAIAKYGITPLHRKTFAGVREYIRKGTDLREFIYSTSP